MSSWKCVKCGNEEFEKDQLQATGGNFSKVFNVQNKKFITISCKMCIRDSYQTHLLHQLLTEHVIHTY